MVRGLVFLGILFVAASRVGAQCRVSSASNEGKLLAFYTAPIAFSMATAPAVTNTGYIRFGAELEYLPKPDPALEQTGACFSQKSEDTSLSPVFGRPRITIGAPLGFTIELAYLPPVTIARAKPHLLSFAVAQTTQWYVTPATATTIMFRGHGTFGNVKGSITCSDDALQQTAPGSPCYGSEPSNDTFRPEMFGGEIAAGINPFSRSVALYAGVGANRIDPRFQVGFTDANGNVDRTIVELDEPLTRATVFGGMTAFVREIFDIGLQIYSVPSDATLFRVNGGFRFR